MCKQEHASCGTDPLVSAMALTREVVDVQGGPLKVYEVESNGVKLRLRLSEADARKRGLLREPETAAEETKPKPRRRTAKNKKVDVEDEATGGE